MARITVVGGTGYAGGNIVREAAQRGHEVTAISRKAPADKTRGVTYVEVDVLDSAALAAALEGADVIVGALSPRGALEGKMAGVAKDLADVAQASGTRLGMVGGAGSLLASPNGPTLASGEDFPEEYKPEALEMAGILDDLRASDEALDWFYVSPAANFGAYNPGEHTGTFRIGGDVLIVDDEGNSEISGADFAQAIVDEIEKPAHRRERFSVAY
ncbi:hypothetical protein CATRI_04425 [Corynebacterium atrinae]|uniref:NAD(P)-dependent oxidoreductase n=1 Tax=Corynebacterium atrinae TaxID=1336740 RepID=UPI0025B596A5|nr:NAD(P)H-binding protein [Corynebacterium atrinae]WJY62981.1 hypothetical protein CATRI_04425 [Corynebacterium atrinae]